MRSASGGVIAGVGDTRRTRLRRAAPSVSNYMTTDIKSDATAIALAVVRQRTTYQMLRILKVGFSPGWRVRHGDGDLSFQYRGVKTTTIEMRPRWRFLLTDRGARGESR